MSWVVTSLWEDLPRAEGHDLGDDRGCIEKADCDMAVFARHNFLLLLEMHTKLSRLTDLNGSESHLEKAGSAAKQGTSGNHLVDTLSSGRYNAPENEDA